MKEALRKILKAAIEDIRFVFFSGEYDEYFEDDFLTEEEIKEMEMEEASRETEEVKEEDLRPAA